MKQRSGILTACLAVLIIYNAAQAIQWGSIALVILWVGQQVDQVDTEEAANMLEEYDTTKEEVQSAISSGFIWSVTYVLARLASITFLAWIFFWKKIAFWCYCGSVAASLMVNLWGGDTVWEASIDLVGLAILIALFHVVEPIAWPQLD